MKSQLWQILQSINNNYREQPAFLYRDGSRVTAVTYPVFLEEVQKRIGYYQSVSQKRIGIWAYNSYDWIVNVTGMILAGKDVILLDGNLGDEELLGLGTYADVQLLVVDPDMLEAEGTIGSSIPMQLLGQETDSDIMGNPGDDGDFVCFTSGTSKSAKGVVITTEALRCDVEMSENVLCGENGDKYYLPLPYHHIYGFTEIFHILKKGGTICIGQGARYILKEMESYRPQIAFAVPSMIKYMVQKDGFPSSLHTVYTGGSALQQDVYQAAREKNIKVYIQYGLSETLGAVCTGLDEKAFPWMKPTEGVRFVTRQGGEVGIYLPFHMKGYYKKEADTLAVLDEAAHLFWTGDVGEIDEDGCVRIYGRLRDTIVLNNGEKIHAADTDEELAAIPGVEEAAVIGIDGELIAVFVKNPGAKEEQILEELKLLNQKRYVYARIQKTWFCKTKLPRTTVGKLKRFELEKEYRKRTVEENEGK